MPDDNPDDLLKNLFGPVIYEYTDAQAIEDGVLIPFVAGSKDTGHRITSNAWHELKEHYRANGYQDYTDRQFYDFFFAELLPLVPEAYRQWERQGILTTNYDFRVEKYNSSRSDQLWYIPNEVGGVTTMKPEDY